MSDQCRAAFEASLSDVNTEKNSDGRYSSFWVEAEWTVWQGAWQAARRAEPDRIYKGTNRHGVDARYFEEKLRLLIRDLGNYQADELRRVFERLADATGAEPDRVSRMDVLSLSEAARCLGVAQAKNDADAIASWKAESLRLESAICAKAEPEKVEPVAVAALEAVWCHGYSAGHQDGLGCGHPMSGRCPHTSAHELEYHRDDIMALAAPQQEPIAEGDV